MEKKKAELMRKEMEKERAEFYQAINRIVPKLKKEIEEKNTILISVKELAKGMGPKFEIKHPTTFYWGAKLCLWDNYIYVDPKRKDHEPALLMRMRTPDDKLFKESKDEGIGRDILNAMVHSKPPNKTEE